MTKVPQHSNWYRRPSDKGCLCTRSAARALATGGSSVTSSGLRSLWLHQFQYRSLTLVLRGGGGKKAEDAKKKRKCLVDAVDQVLEQCSGPRVQQHVSSGDTDGLLLVLCPVLLSVLQKS